MAVTRGCYGVVKIKALAATSGAAIVGEVNEWAFEETAEQLDSSSIGDCTKSFTAGSKATTGTFNCHWTSATGDNHGLFVVGDSVYLEIYPGGTGSGNEYFKTSNVTGGGAVLTSIARGGGVDGIVSSTFGYAVNGAFTATSVP